MKRLTTLLILILMIGITTNADPLRPSITIDFNLGLDNSDFRQGQTWAGESSFDYDYNQISMILELPVSQFALARFGLERIEQKFTPTGRVHQAGIFDSGLMMATYNLRLGVKFYLDGKQFDTR